MPDEEPTLLLTRPELQSKEFLAYCEDRAGRRFSAVIAPTINAVPVAYSFESGDARTFIFTSSHAVRQLAPNLAGRQVATAQRHEIRAWAGQDAFDAQVVGACADEIVGVHADRVGAGVGQHHILLALGIEYDQLVAGRRHHRRPRIVE